MQRGNQRKGVILVDILLALSLGALFVALLSESSFGARDIYDRAKARDESLRQYDASAFTSEESMYGNDRVEITDLVSTTSAGTTSADADALRFVRITNQSGGAGTPLCSPRISDHTLIGSYEYIHRMSTPKPADLAPSITPVLLPIDPLLPLTDLQVRNGIAYVSTDSSKASDPDIAIVNIADHLRSSLTASLNTGPGISSIAIAGKHIYAAAASSAAQLHVIRMDSLASLVLEKKFQLPLPYATATPPFGSAIFYDGNKIYLGTEKWDGDEFDVIDVTDPANPSKRGGFEIGSRVSSIYVRGGIAYVASADQNQLQLLDVHDPSHITRLNAFSPSGWQRQEGEAVSLFEGALQLGRTSGGFNITTDAEAFSWASTSSTTLTSPHSSDIPGGVYGIVADKSYVFLATRQVNREFQIFDHDLSTSTSAAFSLPVAPQTITCDNDKLYILAHTAPYIYEITFN